MLDGLEGAVGEAERVWAGEVDAVEAADEVEEAPAPASGGGAAAHADAARHTAAARTAKALAPAGAARPFAFPSGAPLFFVGFTAAAPPPPGVDSQTCM